MTRQIAALLDSVERLATPAIGVEIIATRGSAPRGVDAILIVTQNEAAGTIGGGQLEFHAIDVARQMLAAGSPARRLEVPLGPFLGQCCGGHVVLSLEPVDATLLRHLRQRDEQEKKTQDEVLLFGLGHTGRAMAEMLALLPLRVWLVDDRADAFADPPQSARLLHLEDPAEAVEQAHAGSAFVIFTHSHALDYRLADAALRRGDAAYVGMIGSQTKLARFRHWFLKRGGGEATSRQLVCPIGGAGVADKRPEIIASLTAAEIITAFARRRQVTASGDVRNAI